MGYSLDHSRDHYAPSLHHKLHGEVPFREIMPMFLMDDRRFLSAPSVRGSKSSASQGNLGGGKGNNGLSSRETVWSSRKSSNM
jgi:hypothetical protein